MQTPVMVGRSAQLAVIDRALAAVDERRSTTIFLIGEAGSGKSRLLHEVRERARERSRTVLAGACPPIGPPRALGVISDALRPWVTQNVLGEVDAAAFRAGLRQLFPTDDAAGDMALSDDQLHLLVADAALHVVQLAGRPRGAVVLLDDVHLADGSSLQVLHHLVTRLERDPILVVAALRDAPSSDALVLARHLEQRRLATVLQLDALSRSNTASLVEVLGGARPSDALVDQLHDASGGVPLFIEHLVRALTDVGATPGGRRREITRGGVSLLEAPRALADVVLRGVDALGPDAGRSLTTAAVLGDAPFELHAAVSGLTEDRCVAGVREAIDAGYLRSVDGRIGFRHELVRQVVHDRSLPLERQRIHRDAAAVAEQLYGDEPVHLAQRAHHLEAAGCAREAAELLVAVGRHALEHGTLLEAHDVLTRATVMAEGAGDLELASESLIALAETAHALGRWNEALTLGRQVLASVGDDPELLVRTARDAIEAGDYGAAAELLERTGSAPPSSQQLAVAALLHVHLDRWSDAERLAEEALELAQASDDPEAACAALLVTAWTTSYAQRYDLMAEALNECARIGEERGVTRHRIEALVHLGQFDLAVAAPPDRLYTARAAAREAGAVEAWTGADRWLMWAAGTRGRVDEAIAIAEELVDVCRRFEMDLLPHALAAAGWAHGLRRCGAGAAFLDDALSAAPDDPEVAIQVHSVRGWEALRLGRFEEAVTEFELAWKPMRAGPCSVPTSAPQMLVGALAVSGRCHDAETVVEEIEATPWLGRTYLNWLWLALGRALVAGDAAEVDQVLASAAQSAPLVRAVGLVLAAAKDPAGESANAWLREALSTFETGGLESDAARARQLLRASGEVVRTGPRPASGVPPELAQRGVTARESDVLTRLGEAMTNAQIAEELFVSVRTVESHVSSLLRKLQLPNRAALATVAITAYDDVDAERRRDLVT